MKLLYKLQKKGIYHEENLPIPVCKLVAEESGKSDMLDSTLSGGLCGIVRASGCGDVATDVTATQRQMWVPEGTQRPDVYYLAMSPLRPWWCLLHWV